MIVQKVLKSLKNPKNSEKVSKGHKKVSYLTVKHWKPFQFFWPWEFRERSQKLKLENVSKSPKKSPKNHRISRSSTVNFFSIVYSSINHKNTFVNELSSHRSFDVYYLGTKCNGIHVFYLQFGYDTCISLRLPKCPRRPNLIPEPIPPHQRGQYAQS